MRRVSAIGARLPQRLGARLGFGQGRCDETPSVVLVVATTGAARLWSAGSAMLVFRSPSLRAAVALVRRVPRRCRGAREGPPPGPPSRGVRSRGDQRRAVDGRVGKGLCSRSRLSSMTRASGMSDRVRERPAGGMSAPNPLQERHMSGRQAAVAVARGAGHGHRPALRCTAMPWRGITRCADNGADEWTVRTMSGDQGAGSWPQSERWCPAGAPRVQGQGPGGPGRPWYDGRRGAGVGG